MKTLKCCLFVLLVVSVLAAQEPAQTPAPQPPAQTQGPESTIPTEPDLAPQQGEYAGPALLSRGALSSLRFRPEDLRFRPFLSLMGTYDGDITGVTLRADSKVPSYNLLGATVTAGVYGTQSWKHSTLSLDYKINYRDYNSGAYYNGSDQSLALSYERRLSRHFSLTLRESAGLYSRSFFAADTFNVLDNNFAGTPRNELFDNGVYFLTTLADVVYQKTARLSFDFGGDGSLVRRKSSALYGATGYRARGDMAYRLSRYTTINFVYNFQHFEFTKAFGATDIHTVGIGYSARLGRRWELATLLGGSRVETVGIAQVQLDPVIAAILGRSVGIQAFHRVNYAPNGSIQLTRGFRRANLFVQYNRAVTSGNGLLLTSRTESGTVGVDYTGLRRWAVGVGGGYDNYGSLTQTISGYRSYRGGFHTDYRISGALHATARIDFRRYYLENTSFKRNGIAASVGFSFSPGDIPLSIW